LLIVVFKKGGDGGNGVVKYMKWGKEGTKKNAAKGKIWKF
jgi:hypothetical protein